MITARAAAIVVAIALTLPSCNQKPAGDAASQPQTDAPIDVSAIDAATVPSRLVAACHGEVTGFDRFVAQVTLPDGSKAKVYGSLPDRLRIEWPDGQTHLCQGSRALRVTRQAPPTSPLDPIAASRALAMRRLLDVATLGPARRATACERLAANAFRIVERDGAAWRMELQPNALLLASMTPLDGADQDRVAVEGHLRTSTTRIVQTADIAPLGRCTIRFDAVDFAWDETMFEAAVVAASEEKPSLIVGAPQHPTEPVLEPARAARWLCATDPGSWEARAALAQQWTATLREAGQSVAGFCGLARDGDRELFIIPFRAAAGAEPWTPPSGVEVREAAATRALAVYPPTGSFDERRATGLAQLQRAIQDRGLTAASVVIAQPFLHLDEAVPDAGALKSPVVRVAVLLR